MSQAMDSLPCPTGPKIKSLETLSSIDRRCEPPLTGAMCDLLWADPLLEDVLGYRLSDSDYADVSQRAPAA